MVVCVGSFPQKTIAKIIIAAKNLKLPIELNIFFKKFWRFRKKMERMSNFFDKIFNYENIF